MADDGHVGVVNGTTKAGNLKRSANIKLAGRTRHTSGSRMSIFTPSENL